MHSFGTLIEYHGFIQICDYVCIDSLVVKDNYNYALPENNSLLVLLSSKFCFYVMKKGCSASEKAAIFLS